MGSDGLWERNTNLGGLTAELLEHENFWADEELASPGIKDIVLPKGTNLILLSTQQRNFVIFFFFCLLPYGMGSQKRSVENKLKQP